MNFTLIRTLRIFANDGVRSPNGFNKCYLIIQGIVGIYGVRIKQLELPNVVRNGTGPFTLSCIYELEDDETGLVVKWFLNKNQLISDQNELIYQWIPPMAPQDTSVISGRAEYPADILGNPRSHSIIRLREVTIEMGGKYTCIVSTFQEEDIKSSRMTVYAPESSVEIETTVFNETHIVLMCVVQGAWPRPDFEYRVDGRPVNGQTIWLGELNRKNSGFRSRYRTVIKEPDAPVLVECEITIPLTDYRRRKSIVYYPQEFLRVETAFQKNSSSSSSTNFFIASTLLALLLFSKT